MRVALIIDSLSKGGAERQVLYLAEELARLGCEVEVLYYYDEQYSYERLTGSDVSFTLLSRRGGPLLLFRRMWRFLWRGSFDVVHAFKDQACIYGCLAAKAAGVPVVLAGYRCHYQGRGLTRLCHRLLNHTIQGWVVNSRAIAASLVEHIGTDPAKCHVIYNGIDADRFQVPLSPGEARSALGVAADVPIVTIIGRLRPEKNHALFLDMAAVVHGRMPRVRFIVVGDGEELEALEAQAKRLRIAPVVRFLGSRSDIPEILAATDVYVLTSRDEGLPNTVLEAMSAGRPVVCTEYAGVEEALEDGQQGFVVPNRDPAALAAHVCELLADPALREAMGRRGRERVAARFSRRALGEQSLKLYQDALRRATARTA